LPSCAFLTCCEFAEYLAEIFTESLSGNCVETDDDAVILFLHLHEIQNQNRTIIPAQMNGAAKKASGATNGSNAANGAAHQLTIVKISPEELKAGNTKPENIQACLAAFHRDGFAVLEGAIPDDVVDKINKKMLADTDILTSRGDTHYNQGKHIRNISQKPPLQNEWMFREVWANVHALDVIENILGPKPELRFANSNIALGGATERQAVHADAHFDYPDFCFGVVLNIYLCDSYPENGSTELWLGTHEHARNRDQHVSEHSGWIKEDLFNERAKVSPPFQPTVKKGSICIRDLKLWHAGMPNRTDTARIMLAIDYFPKWYKCAMTLRLPLSMKPQMEKWGISLVGIEWVDGEMDHLKVPFYQNLTQDPENYAQGMPNGTISSRYFRETGKHLPGAVVSEHNYWNPNRAVASQ